MEVLQLGQQLGVPQDSQVCRRAAGSGHLACLRWARQAAGYPWGPWTPASAASGGHLDCLAWLHDAGCPWDAQTCIMAAQGGHLACLTFAHEHGCPWDTRACKVAARNGHLKVPSPFALPRLLLSPNLAPLNRAEVSVDTSTRHRGKTVQAFGRVLAAPRAAVSCV